MKYPEQSDAFVAVIELYQDDGHLGVYGDVVKAPLPSGVGLTGAFRGNAQTKMITFGKQVYNSFGHTLSFSPVYGYASDGFEKKVEGKAKPFFFYQEISFSAQGIVGQFPNNEIPIAGVGGNYQHTFIVVRCKGNGLPSGTFEQEA
jgi:hypothetical protein